MQIGRRLLWSQPPTAARLYTHCFRQIRARADSAALPSYRIDGCSSSLRRASPARRQRRSSQTRFSNAFRRNIRFSARPLAVREAALADGPQYRHLDSVYCPARAAFMSFDCLVLLHLRRGRGPRGHGLACRYSTVIFRVSPWLLHTVSAKPSPAL